MQTVRERLQERRKVSCKSGGGVVVTVCSAVGFSNGSWQPDHRYQNSPKHGFCQPTAESDREWRREEVRLCQQVQKGAESVEDTEAVCGAVTNTTTWRKGFISSIAYSPP